MMCTDLLIEKIKLCRFPFLLKRIIPSAKSLIKLALTRVKVWFNQAQAYQAFTEIKLQLCNISLTFW